VLARLETPFDKQKAPLDQGTDLLVHLLTFAGQAARRLIFGRRATPFQLGLGVGQAAAFSRHGAEDALGEFLEDMERANLMRHVAKDRADRLRIEGEPSVVIPWSTKSRSVNAVFNRPKKVVMSGCVGS